MDFANIANIPKELTALPRWVCWRLVPDGDGGKPKKVPYSALTGKTASVDRPAGWTDFETAAGAAQRYGYSGLGFVFVKEDGLVGIDMDDCYDQEKAEFSDTARAVLSRTATYAEFSPSGTGVHVFFRGSVPGRGSRNAKTGVEMYEKARYFTMTGNKIKGAADGIAENEDTLRWIHENYIAAPKKEAKKPKKKGTALSDDELLGLAKNAANGLSFGRLWEGKWQNDYPSQSEADMALCCNLAFWSGRDAEQMDRLFRRSGLMRPKWDERHCAGGGTYGEQTLSRACELTDNVYSRGEIYESGGRYFRSKGDSAYPLTNFIFRPLDKIEGEEETQLTADLVNTDGETFPLSFMTADFTNQQKFKTTLNKRT
ncbi:MAG: DNA primase, partial [Eubacteriales bacterium]|nr:DNA primase [Eubacteriales bacterium]